MCGKKCWEACHVLNFLIETLETLFQFDQTCGISVLLYSEVAAPIASLFMCKTVTYYTTILLLLDSHQLEYEI